MRRRGQVAGRLGRGDVVIRDAAYVIVPALGRLRKDGVGYCGAGVFTDRWDERERAFTCKVVRLEASRRVSWDIGIVGPAMRLLAAEF